MPYFQGVASKHYCELRQMMVASDGLGMVLGTHVFVGVALLLGLPCLSTGFPQVVVALRESGW